MRVNLCKKPKISEICYIFTTAQASVFMGQPHFARWIMTTAYRPAHELIDEIATGNLSPSALME
ncbi:MAG: hypothetical protein EBR13_03435, partial [Rhodobacteraceae bacterium]|nr:hypothetical protein [Paracoccaceae bacterium]